MLSSIIVVKRRSHPVLKPLHPGPKLATTTLARLKRNALVIASVLVAPLVSPATGHAITADEVLIVVNDRSAISQQIGERYRTVRGVDRKSTRLNSSHLVISYAVFCLKKKKT